MYSRGKITLIASSLDFVINLTCLLLPYWAFTSMMSFAYTSIGPILRNTCIAGFCQVEAQVDITITVLISISLAANVARFMLYEKNIGLLFSLLLNCINVATIIYFLVTIMTIVNLIIMPHWAFYSYLMSLTINFLMTIYELKVLSNQRQSFEKIEDTDVAIDNI